MRGWRDSRTITNEPEIQGRREGGSRTIAGRDCVVTSLDDSKHHTVSRHYLGDGGDLRTNDIPPDETRDIYMDILTRLEPLGPEFRVLLEYVGEPREHLHVEYRAMLSS